MIDTLRITDTLRAAGFDDRQARAVAEVQKETVEEGGLATKTDIAELRGDIKELRAMTKFLSAVVIALFAMTFAMFLKIFLA